MSAALQLPIIPESTASPAVWRIERRRWQRKPEPEPETPELQPPIIDARPELETELETQAEIESELEADEFTPPINLAFYRKHTESLLRRYLYASLQVGRAPSILGDPVGRGWASSRPVRTFEDAIIFVLDIEKCLSQLNLLDREILSRIVLQAYTQVETAGILGMAIRTISYKYSLAVDRLTEKLLDANLLVLPD
jgi:hypothetical protein